jgi:hypothetical protein
VSRLTPILSARHAIERRLAFRRLLFTEEAAKGKGHGAMMRGFRTMAERLKALIIIVYMVSVSNQYGNFANPKFQRLLTQEKY